MVLSIPKSQIDLFLLAKVIDVYIESVLLLSMFR